MSDILTSDMSKNLFYFKLTVYMLQIIYLMFIIKQRIFYARYSMYLMYDDEDEIEQKMEESFYNRDEKQKTWKTS